MERNMTESEGTTVTPASCIDHLKTMAWCKQGDSVLVAVTKATPEMIELMRDHEVKVFPGGMAIRMEKSVLSNFQRHHDDGQPLSVVVVWRADALEIWYRKVKPLEYPYDAWSSDTAAAYEQERVSIPSIDFGDQFGLAYTELLGKANSCPTMMPAY